MKKISIELTIDQWQQGGIEEVLDMLPDLLKYNMHDRLIPAAKELSSIIEQVFEQSRNQ